MRLPTDQLKRVSTPLIGFTGDAVTVKGEISLPLTTKTEPQQSTIFITFTVVRVSSAYNTILGRPGLNTFRAVVSTYHILVKFLTPHGFGNIWRNQLLAQQCYSASLWTPPPETLSLETMDSQDEEKILRAKTIEELLSIALDDQSLKKQAKISSRLNPQDADELTKALR